LKKAVSILPNLKIGVQNVTALSITVTLNRLNRLVDKEARIYAPRFPKPQTEGWFVIIAIMDRDEIVAIKRANWTLEKSGASGTKAGNNNKLTTTVSITLPEAEGMEIGKSRKMDVWVVSDAYPGIEYKIEGVVIPDVPRVDDDGKKEKPSAVVKSGFNRKEGS